MTEENPHSYRNHEHFAAELLPQEVKAFELLSIYLEHQFSLQDHMAYPVAAYLFSHSEEVKKTLSQLVKPDQTEQDLLNMLRGPLAHVLGVLVERAMAKERKNIKEALGDELSSVILQGEHGVAALEKETKGIDSGFSHGDRSFLLNIQQLTDKVRSMTELDAEAMAKLFLKSQELSPERLAELNQHLAEAGDDRNAVLHTVSDFYTSLSQEELQLVLSDKNVQKYLFLRFFDELEGRFHAVLRETKQGIHEEIADVLEKKGDAQALNDILTREAQQMEAIRFGNQNIELFFRTPAELAIQSASYRAAREAAERDEYYEPRKVGTSEKDWNFSIFSNIKEPIKEVSPAEQVQKSDVQDAMGELLAREYAILDEKHHEVSEYVHQKQDLYGSRWWEQQEQVVHTQLLTPLQEEIEALRMQLVQKQEALQSVDAEGFVIISGVAVFQDTLRQQIGDIDQEIQQKQQEYVAWERAMQNDFARFQELDSQYQQQAEKVNKAQERSDRHADTSSNVQLSSTDVLHRAMYRLAKSETPLTPIMMLDSIWEMVQLLGFRKGSVNAVDDLQAISRIEIMLGKGSAEPSLNSQQIEELLMNLDRAIDTLQHRILRPHRELQPYVMELRNLMKQMPGYEQGKEQIQADFKELNAVKEAVKTGDMKQYLEQQFSAQYDEVVQLIGDAGSVDKAKITAVKKKADEYKKKGELCPMLEQLVSQLVAVPTEEKVAGKGLRKAASWLKKKGKSVLFMSPEKAKKRNAGVLKQLEARNFGSEQDMRRMLMKKADTVGKKIHAQLGESGYQYYQQVEQEQQESMRALLEIAEHGGGVVNGQQFSKEQAVKKLKEAHDKAGGFLTQEEEKRYVLLLQGRQIRKKSRWFAQERKALYEFFIRDQDGNEVLQPGDFLYTERKNLRDKLFGVFGLSRDVDSFQTSQIGSMPEADRRVAAQLLEREAIAGIVGGKAVSRLEKMVKWADSRKNQPAKDLFVATLQKGGYGTVKSFADYFDTFLKTSWKGKLVQGGIVGGGVLWALGWMAPPATLLASFALLMAATTKVGKEAAKARRFAKDELHMNEAQIRKAADLVMNLK